MDILTRAEKREGGGGPNQEGDIRAGGERASLTNKPSAGQHVAAKLRVAALNSFLRSHFFFFFSVNAVCFQKLRPQLG